MSALFYVAPDLCQGCDVCTSVCPQRAIHIERGVASIDQELCNGCEACLSACPQGAIYSVTEPGVEKAELLSKVQVPTKVEAPIVVRENSLQARSRLLRSPVVRAVGAFLGREVLPRAANALLAAWDRRGIEGTQSSDEGATSGRSLPTRATGGACRRMRHGRSCGLGGGRGRRRS